MSDTKISALPAGDPVNLTEIAVVPAVDSLGATVKYTWLQILTALGFTAGGGDASSALAVGDGGASPTANRSVVISADTPSSGSFPGSAYFAVKRNGAALWFQGLREVATDASAAITDFIWYDVVGGKTLAALSTTSGNFRANGTVRSPAFIGGAATITYSASMTIDASLGNLATITANNGTAFTINAPTNPIIGQWLTVRIRNTSGGALGAVTWNAVFKMAAWTSPATAFSRAITFDYDGTNWVERTRNAADVAN